MAHLYKTLVAVAILSAATLHAQQASKAQFTIRKGSDTVAIEVFSRTATTLTGDIAQTNGPRTQYTLNLRPNGLVQRAEVNRQTRAGGGASIIVNFADTLVTASISSGGQSENYTTASDGHVVPFLAVSFAITEQIVQASHLDLGKSTKWVAMRLGVLDSTTVTVTRFHADSVLLAMPDVQLKVALAPDGTVIGGRHMGQDWLVERKPLK